MQAESAWEAIHLNEAFLSIQRQAAGVLGRVRCTSHVFSEEQPARCSASKGRAEGTNRNIRIAAYSFWGVQFSSVDLPRTQLNRFVGMEKGWGQDSGAGSSSNVIRFDSTNRQAAFPRAALADHVYLSSGWFGAREPIRNTRYSVHRSQLQLPAQLVATAIRPYHRNCTSH